MFLKSPPPAFDSNPPALWHDAAHVQQFLRNVRATIPITIEQIDMMLRIIAAARDEVRTFLVLGCGDSLLASAILDEHPNARGFLIDTSDAEVASARRHLRAYSDRLRFAQVDIERQDWLNSVAAGIPFDAIVSGSAITFSSHESERAFYRQAFDVLRPEGVFINLEHVASATRWTESEWDDRMIEVIFGRQLKSSAGAARVDVARDYYAGASHDAGAPAPLEVHYDWLRAAGFENVECFLKMQELAMFGGQRGSSVHGDQ